MIYAQRSTRKHQAHGRHQHFSDVLTCQYCWKRQQQQQACCVVKYLPPPHEARHASAPMEFSLNLFQKKACVHLFGLNRYSAQLVD